ncbi:reverse transcriptase domain-containing protein [Tanacetum coccineum]
MAPKRATSVADALAAWDDDRRMNGDDSHNSGTGLRRQAPPAREMFPEELDKIKKYVGGLPDMIHGKVRNKRIADDNQQQQTDQEAETLSRASCARIWGSQKPTCYECGAQRHFKRDCPKLKNNNHGNQGGNSNALAKVYAIGRAGTNPDSNIVTGTFFLNNRYASVLSDIRADRSFVSTAFSSQIDITPIT